jgi:hypothetical protein
MIPNNKRKSAPDLCILLDQLRDRIKTEINCLSLGTITTFYPDTQTADIELSYKGVSLIDGKVSDYKPLIKCPVVFLNGGGGYLTFPIASGDTCLVLFNDREIDTWFTTGITKEPQSARVHDMNDGIALVGVRHALNPLSFYSDGIKLYYKGGYLTIDSSGNITISGTSVNINP